MSFKTGQTYHGFKLLDAKHVAEINSEAKLFLHKQSGARVLYLGNDDDNKVFSITFRTPPDDSTGVPHIVEHSVLCGSRKFPIKEPFVELVKGSLNTFLNAMTFPDKTMYPVASRNDKDFRNLMDVYLDAVFYPKMLETPEILMQEGWHYELPDKEA
ncbi:MAG: Peptidase associated, partial [Sporomusa sp.]|nr:Peptidase associated [Sporomusa sp.]